jgi:hypothetical protein
MGIVLAIVGAISTTVPSTTALIDAAWFAAGVSLAVLLSSIFWPVWTHLPVRQFLLLISLTTELEALSAHPAGAEESLARTGERRRLTLPRRLRTRATVLRPGALAPSLRASTCEIFCGPQLGRRSLSSRMETTISSPVASGLETGRRLCSTSPK